MTTNNTLTATQLAAVTGGHGEDLPNVPGDPYAPVGSPQRCTFLASEIQNRKNLIAKDAVQGTIGGDRSELTPRIYGNGAILSRNELEFRQRCR
jgi:hypothetical protein